LGDDAIIDVGVDVDVDADAALLLDRNRLWVNSCFFFVLLSLFFVLSSLPLSFLAFFPCLACLLVVVVVVVAVAVVLE